MSLYNQNTQNVGTTYRVLVGVAAATVFVLTRIRASTTTKRVDHGTNKNSTNKNEHDDTIFTELTYAEKIMLARGMSPVSTITWCDGDIQEAVSILSDRISIIVKKNPWLTGHIVTRNKQDCLAYNPNNTTVLPGMMEFIYEPITYKSLFSTTKIEIDYNTPIADIARILTNKKILLRASCDRIQPLWKVIVLPCAKDPCTRFAVVVSMSHIAGDGATFYALYNSLLGLSTYVPQLDPIRIEDTMEQQLDVLTKNDSVLYKLPALAYNMIRGILISKLVAPLWFFKHLRTESHYYYLDVQEIERIKEAHNQNKDNKDATFISTNDILTSWFFLNSKCSIGRMAINFRGRLKGHSNNHAGNYEAAIFYRVPVDSETPSLIRQSISRTDGKFQRIVTADQPPCNNEFWTANISLISNWSSFAENGGRMSLGDSHELCHFPLLDVTSLLPTTLSICILFQISPGKLGVMVTGTNERMRGLKDNATFLAGSI